MPADETSPSPDDRTLEYQLLDFGDGRKLERFGSVVLDRPSPAAGGVRRLLPEGEWAAAAARFELGGERGQWQTSGVLPDAWPIQVAGLSFRIKPTPFGHVGLFPEQTDNWAWIVSQVRRAKRPIELLNLFAYTGGSTLAAARAGAAVAHVDSARGTVEWARTNARQSELEGKPIRWLVDDAQGFVARELRRGRQYNALVLDPPSYGHGTRGEAWKIDQLGELLAQCAELTGGRPAFALVTCHSPGYDPGQLGAVVRRALGPAQIESGEMAVSCASGRQLKSGVFVRYVGR